MTSTSGYTSGFGTVNPDCCVNRELVGEWCDDHLQRSGPKFTVSADPGIHGHGAGALGTSMTNPGQVGLAACADVLLSFPAVDATKSAPNRHDRLLQRRKRDAEKLPCGNP